jgi:CRP-like cAMP-binding protein
MVVRLLHRVSLFRGLDMASLEQLAALSQPIDVPSGEEPITQGDHGDCFYVIDSGDAEVLINGHKVREIGPGDDFGERALLRRDASYSHRSGTLGHASAGDRARGVPRGADR